MEEKDLPLENDQYIQGPHGYITGDDVYLLANGFKNIYRRKTVIDVIISIRNYLFNFIRWEKKTKRRK